LVFALLLLGIYLWLQRKKELDKADQTKIIVSDQIPDDEAIKAVESPPPATPSDLTRIKGIGPKYAAVLQRAGVMTYSHLARLDSSQIMIILKDAGVPFSDPSTWPEQARLAAEDDWRGLAELQKDI
jgi:predicted flap endonuclease-1-like 5' DNA nuclease